MFTIVGQSAEKTCVEVLINSDFFYNTRAVPDAVVSSLEECIKRCDTTPNCVACVYDIRNAAFNCAILSDKGSSPKIGIQHGQFAGSCDSSQCMIVSLFDAKLYEDYE